MLIKQLELRRAMEAENASIRKEQLLHLHRFIEKEKAGRGEARCDCDAYFKLITSFINTVNYDIL